MAELDKSKHYDSPIITEITPFKNFYVAEDYHKNYYENNKIGKIICLLGSN